MNSPQIGTVHAIDVWVKAYFSGTVITLEGDKFAIIGTQLDTRDGEISFMLDDDDDRIPIKDCFRPTVILDKAR